jgi:CheY-like chemotaxis protein
MENKGITRFVVIDDDITNSLICQTLLRIVFPNKEIQTFLRPQDGLDFISSYQEEKDEVETVLFLDINMPVLSGWDVLDIFAEFPDAVKGQFSIYMLSSSIATEDKQKASANALLSGFIEKPLTVNQLKSMFSPALL